MQNVQVVPPPSRSTGGRPRNTSRLSTVVLALGTAAVYASTAGYSGAQVTDTKASAKTAWRLATAHTVYFPEGVKDLPWQVQTSHGITTNRFPGTTVLASIPYLLFGDASTFVLWPAVITAVITAVIAVVLCHRLLLDVLAPSQALVGAALFGFGTCTWSVSAHALWTHAPAQALLLAAMLALQRGQTCSAAVWFGASIVVRPHLVVVAVVVGAYLLVRTKSWSGALRLAPGVVTGSSLMLAWNGLVLDRWSILGGYSSAEMSNSQSGPFYMLTDVAGSLVSPGRGLLMLSPAFLALIPGLATAWHQSKAWEQACALAGIAYCLVSFALLPFHGGSGFFGYRVVLEPLTLAVPVLARAWLLWVSPAPRRRAAFSALAVTSVLVQLLGATLSTSYYLSDLDVWRVYQPLAILLNYPRPMVFAALALVSTSAALAAIRMHRQEPDGERVA